MTSYAFVLDADGKSLSPTKEVKAWYLIRKKRASLVSKYPMVIRLNKIVPKDEICKDEVRCGIDDGGLHIGITLVQKCRTRNKVLFKGVIEQRNDVKKLMDVRRGYRRWHRYHKRYREARFNNRRASKRVGRIAPSILQKRQAVIRVINNLRKWINILDYWLEDVKIDIRALTDGYKPYNWQYQKSNRLDENIREAVILRDKCRCVECGKSNCRLEVHHIKPRRLNGSNTPSNLITLCESCHQETEGREELYMSKYFALLNSAPPKYLNHAQHVMIGKKWLREQLSSLGQLHLTNGGDTANKRIDWDIEKSHSNDAVCIANLQPDTCGVKEWIIKPMRRQSKAVTKGALNIKHRDLIRYNLRNGGSYVGIVTSLNLKRRTLSFQNNEHHYKNFGVKNCELLWRFNKIYWLPSAISF